MIVGEEFIGIKQMDSNLQESCTKIKENVKSLKIVNEGVEGEPLLSVSIGAVTREISTCIEVEKLYN